jgi:hypothetical protein
MRKIFYLTLISSVLILAKSNAQSSWTMHQDLEKIKIEKKSTQCTYKGSDVILEYIFLKITNKTNREVRISFHLDSYFDGQCRSCGSAEYDFVFKVPANSSLEPVCEFKNDVDKLAVFVKNVNRPNYSSFDKFEINNLVIE